MDNKLVEETPEELIEEKDSDGEITQELKKESYSVYFLDTNIILARVLEHHKKHRQCLQLLSAPVTRYSSMTVKRELTKIQNRRRNYNGLLIRHKLKRGTDFKSYVKGLNIPITDKQFLLTTRRYILNKYRGADWFGMYRHHLNLINLELTKCFSAEIETPLVPKTKDAKLFSEVQSLITNLADCQILLDMIVGLRNIANPLFFTTQDKKDYLTKKTAIQQWYEAYFQCSCFFQMGDITEALAHLP